MGLALRRILEGADAQLAGEAAQVIGRILTPLAALGTLSRNAGG